MNDLNTTLLEGRLVRDPELAYTSKEQGLCNFTIAVNRYYKQDEELKHEVSYFDIVIWGKRAETCGAILKKGRGVRVCGRLKQERWVDEAGNTNRKIRIIAEYVEFKPEFKNKSEPVTTDQTTDNSDFASESLTDSALNPELLQEEEAFQFAGSRG